MISGRKIFAIMAKDVKGLANNVFVLSGLLMVPIMAFVFNMISDEETIMIFANMVIMMNILMNGANIICCMIAEEKEKHTLGVLKSSTVSGLDFLLSKLLLAVGLAAVVNVLVYFMFGLQDVMAFGPFLLLTSAALLPMAMIGAIIGIATKTQAAASSLVAPLVMVPMFAPMLIPQDSAVWDVIRFFFTEALQNGLRAIYGNYPFMSYVGIIGINFAVFLVVFLLFYRRRGLSGK